jgi:hypothetical protein
MEKVGEYKGIEILYNKNTGKMETNKPIYDSGKRFCTFTNLNYGLTLVKHEIDKINPYMQATNYESGYGL